MKKENQNNEMLLKQFAKGKSNLPHDLGIQNCVIYTRVSSKEQMDNNQSLEWQKKYCVEYATKQQFNIKGYFGGTYESAKSDERKEFNRMLKFVKASKEKIDFILVYSLDRFSRTGDSAIYIASELKKTGINIVAVTQPIDTNSHAGALQQNIQFIFSKYDNDLRRQKSIDGMREKLLRGERLGNAPTGYSFVKGADKQTIIINAKGEIIKQAFEWRVQGMSYEQISQKAKTLGLVLPKQTLTDIFRNPFYCGYISHNFLHGEIIKGNHPPLVSEDLFFKVNELKKTDGYKINIANENLPLKVFVKDAETGVPFTGYIVKKKGLYYYKANQVGLKINRSATLMHTKFVELLKNHTIDEKHIEPLRISLGYTFENLTETNTSEKKAISLKLNQVNEELYQLRKRHALGLVSVDIFEEFSKELITQKEALLNESEKLDYKLSNPKELINFSCKLSSNLATVWASGDYYQKQTFQNVLFPQGIAYDAKIDDYRTTYLNSIIGWNAQQAKVLAENKNGTNQNLIEKSRLVQVEGLEPTHLTASDPKSDAAANFATPAFF